MTDKINGNEMEKEKCNHKLTDSISNKTKKIFINFRLTLSFIYILFFCSIAFYAIKSKIKEKNIPNLRNNKIDTKNINRKINNKTIVVIFAGRKRYLKLLLKYLMNLKNSNKIHEIHFWQFTNNKEDLDYISSIANIHKTTGVFKDFQSIYPAIENNEFQISIKQEKEKGGAVILINDQYEITFQFIDNSLMEITITKGDKVYDEILHQKKFNTN